MTYGSTGGGKDPWNFYVVTHGRAPAWCVLQVVRCEGRVWLVSPVLVVVVMTRCRRLSVRMLVLKCEARFFIHLRFCALVNFYII